MSPLQQLLRDESVVACAKKPMVSSLSESHLPKLLCKLNNHASKWGDIGMHLGFCQGELDNTECKPLLLNEGPKAWLREMLREWLEWAPGDSRGSSSCASIDSLKCALDKSGLAQTALAADRILSDTLIHSHFFCYNYVIL